MSGFSNPHGPFWSRRFIPFVNNSGFTVPPHGAMQVDDAEYDSATGEIVYSIVRPSDYCLRHVVFNSHEEVPDSGYGAATADFPCVALMDGGSNYSSFNNFALGTEKDSFYLKEGLCGFFSDSQDSLKTGGGSDNYVFVRPGIFEMMAQSPSGGIPARSGSQPGAAACTLFRTDDTGPATGELATLAVSLTVHNYAGVAVGGTKYIKITMIGNGTWAVDLEDCA